MGLITCTRCQKTVEGFVNNPYAGTALGAAVAGQVCEACWKEWERMELMLINEYRLTPFYKPHRELLVAKMKEFLGMK